MILVLTALSLAASPDPGQAQLRLTLVDLPYNLTGAYRAPSMAQSLDLAYAVDRLVVYGVRAGFDRIDNPALRSGLGLPTLGLAHVAVAMGPVAWVHEEWHRAVLGSAGIHSRNGLYHPAAWHDGLIPVDQVSDAELARLKAENPANTARLMSAGLEAQHALALRVGDGLFLHDTVGKSIGPLWTSQSWMAMSIQVAQLAGFFYDVNCASEQSDAVTDRANRVTLTELDRDFGGLDCTAWIYDMRRPDEPYEARGPHPYGAGVDRYRSHEDLSPAEVQALRNQVRLHLINLANPHLFYIDGFALPSGGGDRFIAALGQQPAPFGWVLDARFGLRRGAWASVSELHLYVSGQRVSPGLETHIPDRALWGPLSMDLTVGAWLQPEGLRWDAAALRPGGRVCLQLDARAGRGLEAFVAIDAKTAGWVMGDAYLGPNVSGRAGLVVHLP